MGSWVKFFWIGNPNVHIRWFPRLSFFHRQSEFIYPMVSECACPMISSDGFLGAKPMISSFKSFKLAIGVLYTTSLDNFLDWQPERACPMGSCFFGIGNPNVHIQCVPTLSFFHWQTESIYPIVSEFASPIISSNGFLGTKPMVSWASLFLDWQSECAYPMVSWVIFFDWKSVCAYPVVSGVKFSYNAYIQWLPRLSFSRLETRMCISDVSWRMFS